MIIYWLVFFIIAICGLYNWKRTVIGWIPFSMLFNDGVCLKYQSPSVSLELAVDIYLLAVYYFAYRKRCIPIHGRKIDYFFKSSFIAYSISYFFSMIFSIAPLSVIFTGTIKFFVEGFVLVYLFQLALSNKEDVNFIIKCLLISLIIISILGVIEFVYKLNPVLTFVYLNAPSPDLLDGKLYFNPLELDNDYDLRYGMRRTYSFFSIHIAYGCACSLWFFMCLYFVKY